MEKMQYRALRLVFNDFDSSYKTLLEKVNRPTLHVSWIRLVAIETFKIVHKMSPVLYLHDLLSYKNSTYSFRYDNLIDVPRVRTTKYGKSTFCYEAAQVWNSLPNNLRKVDGVREADQHMEWAIVQVFNVQNLIYALLVQILFALCSLFALLFFILVLFFNFVFIFSLLIAFKFLTYFYFLFISAILSFYFLVSFCN